MKYVLLLFTFWLSFLLAIDFFETPIRFSTKQLTMHQAVRIGRNVFKQLLRLEFLLLSVALFQGFRLQSSFILEAVLILGVLLVVQQFYLLPLLDQRAVKLLAGVELTPSWHHAAYIVVELGKCALLGSLVIKITKNL